jgi:hypothetical protein
VRDIKYLKAFLEMMADNRFNTLTLWNLHPFPYMIRARNFERARVRLRPAHRVLYKNFGDPFKIGWNMARFGC